MRAPQKPSRLLATPVVLLFATVCATAVPACATDTNPNAASEAEGSAGVDGAKDGTATNNNQSDPQTPRRPSSNTPPHTTSDPFAGGSSATPPSSAGADGMGGNSAQGGAANNMQNGGATGEDSPDPLPKKIVAGYYPNWTPSPVRLRDVAPGYNVIYLFAAKPIGGSPGTTGAVTWTAPGDGRGAATHFNADLAFARTEQHRRVILSVGGAGAGMSFPNRAKSQTFVDSVSELYEQLGGFDGLDWNTFEADQAPDTDEMIWMSLQLKQRYPGFIISAPPAPWNKLDQAFCQTMVEAGAMDYAAPQYYDGPNLATASYLMGNASEWVNLLGAEHVVIGFGVWDQPNYWTIEDAIGAWNTLETTHTGLRGSFNWQIHIDEAAGWSYAGQLGPLVTD